MTTKTGATLYDGSYYAITVPFKFPKTCIAVAFAIGGWNMSTVTSVHYNSGGAGAIQYHKDIVMHIWCIGY